MKPRRILEISFVNVLLCLLVIFIHITSPMITGADKTAAAYAAVLIPWRLASFAVQGFLFLSGMKLMLKARERRFNYPVFLRKRFVAVILPYAVWVFVYYLYFCREGYFPFNVSELPGYLLRGDLVSHFYFVVIIAQFYLLAPLWNALIPKVSAFLLIPASLLLMPVLTSAGASAGFAYTDRIFTTYIFYWVAGCSAGLYYNQFQTLLRANRVFIATFFFLSAAANAVLSFLHFTGRMSVPWLENVHILYCASAVIFCLSFAPRVSIPLAARFDQVTYAAYLAHVLVIFITDDFLPRFVPSGLSLGVMYILRLCIVYFVVVSGSLIWQIIKINLPSHLHGGGNKLQH